MTEPALDQLDRRLIAALQCDGRLTAQRAATVLGSTARVVHRRWSALLREGTIRVVAHQPRSTADGAMMLHIRVLRGRLGTITAALAAREDIPFVDVSAGGDEISAVLLGGPDPRNRLVFRQLPATNAVTSVDAQTIMHVFATSSDWRLDALTEAERAALTAPAERQKPHEQDELDAAILAMLADDARTSAADIAEHTGSPESTVRRRLSNLLAEGQLITEVVIDPRRLGLLVDANIRMRVPPAELDAVGTALARHPAVHGAMATTGQSNLNIAVWLRDLEDLYRFVTRDLAGLGVTNAETTVVGHAVKRPGVHLSD